jgi:hypothetical protein
MKTDSQIIDDFGGNEVVAEICHPTQAAVVSGWRKRGIPRAWRAVLKLHSPQHFNFENTKDAA